MHNKNTSYVSLSVGFFKARLTAKSASQQSSLLETSEWSSFSEPGSDKKASYIGYAVFLR